MDILFFIYAFIVLLTGYVLLSLLIFIYQQKFIFSPIPLPSNFIFECDETFEELYISVGVRAKINCVHIKLANPRGCVLYHHGNTGNLSRWLKRHKVFTQLGYDVFMYDYRGFGKSTGRLTESRLYNDANSIYNYLKSHYIEKDIVQYGISLGSGIATKLAVRVGSRRLILETPYLSMYHMAEHKMPWIANKLLLSFHIRTDKFIQKYKGLVGIIHGTDDELIPYEQALSLYELSDNATMLSVKGGRHNNLDAFKEYEKEIEQLLL